jgi:sugar phosphate isomerase/epimerase
MGLAMARDLLAAHWMATGQRPDMNPEPCRVPLRERAQIAVAAGCLGIGIMTAELERECARHGTSGVRAMLEDAGIKHVELEVVSGWWKESDEWRRSLDFLEAAGSAIGARIIKVTGDFSSTPVSLEAMAEAFGPVAAVARQGGVPLALEIIAFSNVMTVPDALVVLGDTLANGAGLMLDSWHFARRTVALEPLAALPPGAILGVEIADLSLVAHEDIFLETLDHRYVPGEGVYDLAGFLGAVDAAGYDGPIGLEVLSASLRTLPVEQALARCVEGARSLMQSR